jgi:hypothetical protein
MLAEPEGNRATVLQKAFDLENTGVKSLSELRGCGCPVLRPSWKRCVLARCLTVALPPYNSGLCCPNNPHGSGRYPSRCFSVCARARNSAAFASFVRCRRDAQSHCIGLLAKVLAQNAALGRIKTDSSPSALCFSVFYLNSEFDAHVQSILPELFFQPRWKITNWYPGWASTICII